MCKLVESTYTYTVPNCNEIDRKLNFLKYGIINV